MLRRMAGWWGAFSDNEHRLSQAASHAPRWADFIAARNSPSQGTLAGASLKMWSSLSNWGISGFRIHPHQQQPGSLIPLARQRPAACRRNWPRAPRRCPERSSRSPTAPMAL